MKEKEINTIKRLSKDEIKKFIKETVHKEYYGYDTNCATVTLICLSYIFEIILEEQLIDAASGMHGAGGYRAQCGLVEGSLMFLGIYGNKIGLRREEIIKHCFNYGKEFEENFGSLTCRELRPGGFNKEDPPHLCEDLTNKSILFTCEFIRKNFAMSID